MQHLMQTKPHNALNATSVSFWSTGSEEMGIYTHVIWAYTDTHKAAFVYHDQRL